MRVLLIITAFIVTSISLTANSSAQGLDEQCLQNKDDICGSQDADICFDDPSRWKLIKPECEGDIQTLIEMAHESRVQMRLEGASLGGKVRSGPGMDYQQVGSLAEGDLLLIEENTGILMNGYPWFKVSRISNPAGKGLQGYQWGGILCAFDEIPGVFNRCPAGWSYNPERIAVADSGEDGLGTNVSDIRACLRVEAENHRDGSGCIGSISGPCLADGNDTTVDMRECIGLELRAWDTLLNENYRRLMVSLDTEANRESLREAQRAWIRFVEKFCPLGYEFNQGTLYLVTGDHCVMDMTARHTLELRGLLGECR